MTARAKAPPAPRPAAPKAARKASAGNGTARPKPPKPTSRTNAHKSVNGNPVVKSLNGSPARAAGARASSARKAAEIKPASQPAINTFSRALRFLNTLSDFERLRIVRYTPDNFNLQRMRTLCRHLGDPQRKFRSVHVAGTKGKGSTCAMIAAMLRAAGYTVGLYASPHLVDVRERIRILRPTQDARALPQGEMVSQAEFARLTQHVEPFVSNARLRPSYFDALTAIAFRYFADQKVDIAVIETGLGGRLDSTNILEPLVTAITPISMDHMRQLGPSLAKIAAEKAGIFKPATPAVTCEQPPEAEAILRQTAGQIGAEIRVLGQEIDFSYRFEASRMLGRHNRVCFNTTHSSFDHLSVPLLGEHQAVNCGIALAVIDELKHAGFEVTDEQCAAGLDGLKLDGRMEVVRQDPTVVVDAAHNAHSVEAMLRALGQHFTYDSALVIFGCCNDKDIPGMLAKLVAGADKIIFTRIDSIRSADPKELAAAYTERFGRMAQTAESLTEALQIARRSVTDDDLICITGSFYLVGSAKKLLAARTARRGV